MSAHPQSRRSVAAAEQLHEAHLGIDLHAVAARRRLQVVQVPSALSAETRTVGDTPAVVGA